MPLNIQYGAALIVAPIICYIYMLQIDISNVDHFWIFSDLKSFFFLIIFFPIVEELAFRGMIQEFIYSKSNFRNHVLFLTYANIFTSILFSLMHLIHHIPIFALLTFFPSLVFGYFKDKYGHVLHSIILHIFYNLSFVTIVGNRV